MNNRNLRGIEDTQTLLKSHLKGIIREGDYVIDGTAGRGRDTLFLAQCVGPQGQVYAFDIQEEAITATEKLLLTHHLRDRVVLLRRSHDEITVCIKNRIKAAIFNLGYLPDSANPLTTKAETTLEAVKQVLVLLEYKGVLALTVYRGHEGGLEESDSLLRYISGLPKKDFSVLQGIYLNQGGLSPYWIMIQNNREDKHENPSTKKNSGTHYQ